MTKEIKTKTQLETSTHIFEIAIDNQEINDMKKVMNEYTNWGYEKAFQGEYEGNTILIYSKEK